MKNHKKAKLVLEDGSVYEGYSFGYLESSAGEVVFNTGMAGYPQSLTDPSYAGQILIFTYPLIGNYGVGNKNQDENLLPLNFESDKIHVKGVIVSEYCQEHNHWDSEISLEEWLIKNKIPGIFGIDTRALTIKIREKGVMLGKIIVDITTDKDNVDDKEAGVESNKVDNKEIDEKEIEVYNFNAENMKFYDPNTENLVKSVSRKDVKVIGSGKYKIIAVDCGMKYNQIRCLLKHDVTLKIVPWDYDFNNDLRGENGMNSENEKYGNNKDEEEGDSKNEKQEEYDGLFISNGPGNPVQCQATIENIKKAMELKKPIFGICLGNQLLALAAGAKTYKLKYGHRSQNQPCVTTMKHETTQYNAADMKNKTTQYNADMKNETNIGNGKKGFITSQNHGFAVDKKTLPKEWEELFYNANDGTNEGIRHKTLPFFSVQFHPEGSCGPKDTGYLFDEFVEMIRKSKEK